MKRARFVIFLFAGLLVMFISRCTIETDSLTAIKDSEGNTYRTVKIGKQRWMAENLRATTYTDGTAIPLTEVASGWAALKTPGYCWYDNYPELYRSTYGAIYNFYALDTETNGNKSLCPEGWHIPSVEEWEILFEFVGGIDVAGEKLKIKGEYRWFAEDNSDPYRFSAYASGYRTGTGEFKGELLSTIWWTSTSEEPTMATQISLSQFNDAAEISPPNMARRMGAYVRCIKD